MWRFVVEGESADPDADESQIRADAAPRLGDFGSYLVAATYTLHNGTKLPGVVQLDLLGTQVECLPALIFARGKSIDPLAGDAASRLERVLKQADVQPIAWQLDVLLQGERTLRGATIKRLRVFQLVQLLAQLWRLRRVRRNST